MSHIQPQVKTTKSGAPFTIRPAQPDDAATLLTYIRTIAQETPFFLIEADEFDFTEEQERMWIQDHFDRPGWIALMAVSAGNIIGTLNCENGLYRRMAHRATFGISVAKQWRRQGVGTALLETFLQWAKEKPLIEKVGMDVFVTNENAMRLYKKSGFAEEGIKTRDVKIGADQYVDVVSMYRLV